MQLSINETLTATVVVPQTERDYNELVSLLDNLIDEVGEDESHPLASLMDVVGVLIEHYEDKNIPEITE
jgi:HTH-type transcriptional regulator / antitoxin HigA